MFFQKDEIATLEQQVAALDRQLGTIKAKAETVADKIAKEEGHQKARLADEDLGIDDVAFGKITALREQAKALSGAANDIEQNRAAAASRLAGLRNKRDCEEKARQLEGKAAALETAVAEYVRGGTDFAKMLDGVAHPLTDGMRLAVHNSNVAATATISEIVRGLKYSAAQLRSPVSAAAPVPKEIEPQHIAHDVRYQQRRLLHA